MPSHAERCTLPYTTQQLFDLVADIERYPEFLPWCRAARVLERREGEFIGELVISFHHLTESYTSRVTLSRPATPQDSGSIAVVMVKGPFEHLTNHWKFSPAPQGTEVDFALDFKFRSRIMEKLIGGLFTKATAKMVEAFTERAAAMYGSSHG
ncbi:MAG: type II toxin-antitoxin system RatA family toxin [Proteobacteria bacterium]|nr:type II toxin-antitoxin system RatA family toxin [Pseudomonadota bacterium]